MSNEEKHNKEVKKDESKSSEIKSKSDLSIEDMSVFCKRKGFVYSNSELYGGLSGFFDYGHLGVELNNNLKREWWKFNVQKRKDVVGVDGSIITHPKVWEASGHVANFADLMLTCSNKKCNEKLRADFFVEQNLNVKADGMNAPQINELVRHNNLKCPKCDSEFEEIKEFNLMFKTTVGPYGSESSEAYLRPETAQLIFADFKLVVEHARLKLPFGIAQVGKAFRNEISPRDFLFRCREFEQMEIEYFVHPNKYDCPYVKEIEDYELLVYSEEMQKKDEQPKKMKIRKTLSANIIKTAWHAYWMVQFHKWFVGLGANPDKFRIRQHVSDEKSHYALDTWDLEYEFPFGWKELQGFANRTDFDLKQHSKVSGKEITVFDEESKQHVVPHVICEPSLGVGRALLVFLFDAYEFDEKRQNIVLKLHPKLAPVKAGIFPLMSNKEELVAKAEHVFDLLKEEFYCQFDKSGSIGRRYARQDEQGTPYCITVDFDSLNDDCVTVRDRDTTVQKRVKIKDVAELMHKLINGKMCFEEILIRKL